LRTRRHNLWVLIEREEGGDTWIAHCLDWDVVTFGRDLRETLQLTLDVVLETALEDVRTGQVRTAAPPELWARLRSVQERGVFTPTVDLLTNPHAGDGLAALATQVAVEVAVDAAPHLLPTSWAAEPLALAS
jgi:hypothetical protein